MKETETVKGHFNKYAAEFDRLYSGEKSGFLRWVNRRFRASVYRRFEMTMEALGDVRGKTVLDVGCGSGRYGVELAKRGAKRVVGIDMAENMLAIARAAAQREGVGEACEFIASEFLEMPLAEQFDFSLALGVFDYVWDPAPVLRKMAGVTSRRLVASFPHPSPWRAAFRRVRYRLATGCPVYFYDEGKVRSLLAGLPHHKATVLKAGSGSPDLLLVLDVEREAPTSPP